MSNNGKKFELIVAEFFAVSNDFQDAGKLDNSEMLMVVSEYLQSLIRKNFVEERIQRTPREGH